MRDFARSAPSPASAGAGRQSRRAASRHLRQFIELARRNPGSIDIASAGLGTVPHLAIELLERALKIRSATTCLSRQRAGACWIC
jgi:hypothetical protein